MKKLLALLLVITMLSTMAIFSVSAENVNITDDFLNAVRYEYDNYSIKKDDVEILSMLSFDKNRYVVNYMVFNYWYTDDMHIAGLNNYILESPRPEPKLYYHGKLYDLEYAYDNYMLSDKDLDAMYESGLFDMRETKVHLDLLYAMGSHKADEYINVRFEVVGSDFEIYDIENWIDDIGSAREKLNTYYEELHSKLVNEVLADVDHIDRVHNNGISVVALKKDDIEKVAENDFVVLMEYMSEVHMKYIDTYSPDFKEYTYKELKTWYNTDHTPQYEIIKAHGNMGSTAEIWFRLGNSVVYSPMIYSDFECQYGLYDYAQDKFIELQELKDTPQLYTNLEKNLLDCGVAKPMADSDGDGRVTVVDATNIQRYLAKLDHEYINYFQGDMDNDGKLSLIDATMIQKLVAKV